MVRLLTAVLVCLLAGCSLMQEREKRFMPAPTIQPVMIQAVVDDCAGAFETARGSTNKTTIARFVDTCSAVTALHCDGWIDVNLLAENGIAMKDSTANAAGSMSTLAAAAFGLSPAGVAAVGAGQMALHLAGQVEKTGLGAPEGFTAQSALMTAQESCSDKLLVQAKAGELGIAKAISGINRCKRFCSSGAASAITTQALTGVEVEAAPSGRLMIKRPQ